MKSNWGRVTIGVEAASGFVFGVLLLFAQINLSIGLPLILLGLGFYYKNLRIDLSWLDVKVALFVKALWVTLIWFVFKSTSLFVLLQTLSVDVVLVGLVFFKFKEDFFRGLAVSLSMLVVMDLCFNLMIYGFGVDPLGRGGALRAGDLVPRVGGVFGHAFYSVNISVVGLICGLILRSKLVLYLSVMNFLINGTFRSPIALIGFVLFFVAIKYELKLRTLVCGAVVFAGVVVLATLYTAGGDEYGGNVLRVVAWANSIDNIAKNPLLGTHTFLVGPIDDMSADIIVDYGIAESAYLQYALDYGVLPMLLHFFVIFRMLNANYRLFFGGGGRDRIAYAALVFAGMIFTDTFYGTLFGSVLTTCFGGLLLLSYSKGR